MIIRRRMPYFVATIMCSLIMALGFQITAHADMVSTGTVIAEQRLSFDRHQIMMTLEREDVRSMLVEHGVDPDNARDRVAAMNNDEIDQMANRLNELAAGADAGGVIAVLGILFVFFIITDLMGYTNVFSFVR